MSRTRATAAARLRSRHEALRDLLDRNGTLLELLAEVQLDLRVLAPGDPRVRTRTLQLAEAALLQAQTLNILSGDRYRMLYAVHGRIESEIRAVLGEGTRRLRSDPVTVPLSAGGPMDRALVGGKAARLGMLRDELPDHVPDGFVITSGAWARFLAHGQSGARLSDLMKGLDLAVDAARLEALAARIRDLVLEAPIPAEVDEAIREEGSRRGSHRWAVRSSAVGEDGPFSFAGQFETVLHVPPDGLVPAWRRVIASSFSAHVIRYRHACGMFELASPMAVLCMPMVAARSSGVLYTREPSQPGRPTMLISAVAGLATDLVGGVAGAETTLVSRETFAAQAPLASGPGLMEGISAFLSAGELARLVQLGLECEGVFKEALDVEWAIDHSGAIRLLQARPLASMPAVAAPTEKARAPALVRGGLTVVGGRAVGTAFLLGPRSGGGEVPEGSVLVVRLAVPELGHLLPGIEGLVAEHGSVSGHLAALAREFGVPSVFGMPEATTRIAGGEVVSLDATECVVHAGPAWPSENREARRRARALRSGTHSPLHPLVLRLDLTDPHAASFRPRGCRSLHDIVRFCHERGIAAMFEEAGWRRRDPGAGARRLRGAAFPDGVWVIDAGGGVVPARDDEEELEPQQVLSRPFHALWRGLGAPGVTWSGRRHVDLRGFASVVSSSLTEADRDGDSLGGAAYLVVATDYVNLNARMAYHYAMIDSLVGDTPESNYVSFRFWGGGAGRAQRDLRAVFLAEVLERSGFVVERRGDLVTSRLRRQAWQASESGLELLGRLMGCARQLDMMLRSEAAVCRLVDHFMAGEYEAFE